MSSSVNSLRRTWRSGRLEWSLLLLSCAVAALPARTAGARPPSPHVGTPAVLASGLQGAVGSTIGPDGALYVAEGLTGTITRIDRVTGAKTTFATGLPTRLDLGLDIGGVVDVAFVGDTAYSLVTLVSADVGGSAQDGVYRLDGPGQWSVVADIGAFASSHVPTGFPVAIPTGLQYAMQPFRGGFLVTDGHHNRVYEVSLDGRVTQLIQFGDVVPTGLDVWGNAVYLASAGQIVNDQEIGGVLALRGNASTATEVASGLPLIVDVERGRGATLFAISQGTLPAGGTPATPAEPNTGSLARVANGSLTELVGGLDRPTSLEIVGTTAYVVTLAGDVLKIADIARPPYGRVH
jgi:hypothetical protein